MQVDDVDWHQRKRSSLPRVVACLRPWGVKQFRTIWIEWCRSKSYRDENLKLLQPEMPQRRKLSVWTTWLGTSVRSCHVIGLSQSWNLCMHFWTLSSDILKKDSAWSFRQICNAEDLLNYSPMAAAGKQPHANELRQFLNFHDDILTYLWKRSSVSTGFRMNLMTSGSVLTIADVLKNSPQLWRSKTATHRMVAGSGGAKGPDRL